MKEKLIHFLNTILSFFTNTGEKVTDGAQTILDKVKVVFSWIVSKLTKFRDFLLNIDWQNVKPGTWARYIIGILVTINMILTSLGINPIPYSEDKLYIAISSAIQFIAILVNTYKNNSTSKEAIKADEYMTALKSGLDEMLVLQDRLEKLDKGTFKKPYDGTSVG